MAYTKIHAIRTTLTKALDYIENPEKTDGQLLVSGYNVDPLTASMEFTMTRVMARNMMGEPRGKKGAENLAYHLIQSFSPQDNVTPEQAHELGRRLANELLEGKYEYVISTHIDRGHIHNHIIFNATSFCDFRKFQTRPGRTVAKIRGISDRICAQAELSVIETPGQLGRSYPYKAPGKSPGWRRNIRRRLNYALQAAESFEELVEGAARLGVTVDASGKELKYWMEGQERAARAGSMDKEGAYTRQGLEERLALGLEARARVKLAIQEAVAQAGTEKGFQAALAERGVTAKKTRRSGWKYTVDGETAVWEWTLGPAYCAEAVRHALAEGGLPAVEEDREGWLDRLEGEFLRASSGASNEVAVQVDRALVVRTTKDGILLRTPDGDGQIFIDRGHVTYEKETDSFRVHLGGGYRYDVSGPEGQAKVMQGEALIRALELAGGVQPELVELAPANVGAISPKGLTLAIPELGIRSLFLEDRFLEYAPAGSGVRAAVYGNWSYRFETADGSTRYVAGSELAAKLRGRQGSMGQPLLRRVNAMERRKLGAKTDRLAQALLLARREGIEDLDGFAPRLAQLREQRGLLEESIRTLEARNAAYRTAAKYLMTYHDYLPVKLKAMVLDGKARASYEREHEAELSAWSHAERFLTGSGVQPEVDPEKVKGLIEEQAREAKELRAQADALAAREAALEQARDELSWALDQDLPPQARQSGPEL